MEETVVRVLQGRASEEEKERVTAWRQEDPENEKEYRRLAAVWNAVGAYEEPPETEPPPVSRIIRLAEERRRAESQEPDPQGRRKSAS